MNRVWILLSIWSTAVIITHAVCPKKVVALYRMVLKTEWSMEKFPKQYPEYRPPAQWSVVAGQVHKVNHVLWRLGETATDPVKLFVETGNAELLIRENKTESVLLEFFAAPIMQGVGYTNAKFFTDAENSKVSFICRITPSPDWFIGLDSFDLCKENKWIEHTDTDLYPIDGGTSSGYAFTSPKWTTDPRSKITEITSSHPNHPVSSFFYPENLPRIASVSFYKLKEWVMSTNSSQDEEIAENVFGDEGSFKPSPGKHIKKPKNALKRLPLGDNKHKKSEKRRRLHRIPIHENGLHVLHKAKRHHKIQSCRVSDWGAWRECSNSCGFGEQERNRKVIHYASRGGRPCPPLVEKRWCKGSTTCGNKTSNYFRWQFPQST